MILIIEDKLCYIETMSIDICPFFREQIDLQLYSCSWPTIRQWFENVECKWIVFTWLSSSDSAMKTWKNVEARETLGQTERIQQSSRSQVQWCPVHSQTKWGRKKRHCHIFLSFFIDEREKRDRCLLSWWTDSHLNRQTDVLINAICSRRRLNEEQISCICVTGDESIFQQHNRFRSLFLFEYENEVLCLLHRR